MQLWCNRRWQLPFATTLIRIVFNILYVLRMPQEDLSR